jgi:hypothetical protein
MKSTLLIAAACSLLVSCSEPTLPKKVEKPPEPVTGRHALQQMFVAAHTWAQDLQIANMTSMHFTQVKDAPGKAGGWQVTFVSPSLQQSRTYTWAAAEISTSIHEGTRDEQPQAWSGSGKTFPFDAVKIDSDEAYQTAITKDAKYAGEHPGMVITYQLTLNQQVPDAVWRIVWGENVATSSDSVLVDASTGQYMGTLH